MDQATAIADDALPPLAVLAHELRTPLAAIQAYADLMLETPTGPAGEARLREHARQIRLAAEMGLDVLASLLERNQAAVGLASVVQTVSLETAAARVARIMAPLVDRTGGHLTIERTGSPVSVATMPIHVHEILTNLVANALRHAGPAPKIVMRSGVEPKGAPWIEVEDDGPGLATDASAGTGLAISRMLAREAGASLDALRAKPRGARLRLTFAASAVA